MLKDALGNELHRFDVVHYGARSGTNSSNRTLMVLGVTEKGLIKALDRQYRFQGFDPETDLAIRKWELRETVIRLPGDVVKVHPDYWDDNIKALVQEAKEVYT